MWHDTYTRQLAAASAEAVVTMGLAQHSRAALTNLLLGRDIMLQPSVKECGAQWKGHAHTNDLEILFQLLYLFLHAPRADQQALRTWVGTLPDAHPALKALQEANAGSLLALYQKATTKGNLTLVLVGDADAATVTSLIDQYLCRLPERPEQRHQSTVSEHFAERWTTEKVATSDPALPAEILLQAQAGIETKDETHHPACALALETMLRRRLAQWIARQEQFTFLPVETTCSFEPQCGRYTLKIRLYTTSELAHQARETVQQLIESLSSELNDRDHALWEQLPWLTVNNPDKFLPLVAQGVNIGNSNPAYISKMMTVETLWQVMKTLLSPQSMQCHLRSPQLTDVRYNK